MGLHKQVVSVPTVECRKVQVRIGLGARTSRRGENKRKKVGVRRKRARPKARSQQYIAIGYYVV